MSYKHRNIEEKWQKYWEENRTYEFIDEIDKPKFYLLDMFPYPSGQGLHVGHIKGYLATDIMARYKKMRGFCVLHPIGWDSFGLPAEQYAINQKKDPNEFTLKNINFFREQLKKLSFSFDYSLEINTSDPNYYKTTQWIFAQMYRHNLAELQDTLVNWCPELNTVLSNEEIVNVDGKFFSERGNFPVEAKKLKQWILKITNYSEELIKDLDEVEWSEKIKKIQLNWIGKKEKYKFPFKHENKIHYLYLEKKEDIFRLKHICVHEFSEIYLQQNKKINGGEKLDISLINCLNNKAIDLFFLQNVDFREDELLPCFFDEKEYKEEPTFNLDEVSIEKITTYKLRNWVFSRQRYWGEPFPIFYDKQGSVFVEEKLPVILPKLTNFEIFFSNKSSPLAAQQDWINIDENHHRDVNTMPNWAGSSWYFLAYLLKTKDGNYLDLSSKEAIEKIKRWMPVDIYIGGQEHANLHLLYARFWYKFLNKLNIVNNKEPFKKLINQGMVLSSDGTKMSKSKGNVVNTSFIVDEFGGDLLRLNIAFMGPTEVTQKWEQSQIIPLKKWLEKIYNFFINLSISSYQPNDHLVTSKVENKLLKNVEVAIEKWSCNTIVSELMICFNSITKDNLYSESLLFSFVKILSFLSPCFAEELWMVVLKQEKPIFLSSWPEKKEDKNIFNISVQINNKFKLSLKVEKPLSKEELFEFVINNPEIKFLLENKTVKNYFAVPNKAINLIV